ncbi:polyprenyl synthetase family protein [Latilactobacillus fuchuensis]|nr:farnesyl diphosphate synthase [Latilactobacillus fuchuensis]MCP8857831.1 polyprenyl synthetase family protein [Latilactobacillus fuchuensis]SPC37761.1 geranyltranstransferase [Latilactobacillus fuchuensis]
MTDFTTFGQQQRPQFEAYLEQALAHQLEEPTLKKAMQYSVMAGGKRLRPLLLFAVLESAKLPIDLNAMRVAGALELVHSYSLIHDDLPAMDNDDLRRGRPTNHKVFGEAQAILAGDGLLTLAFDWLTTTNLPADKQVQLVRILAQAAGANGMVAGQVEDIEGQTKQLRLAQLKQLHHLKTGCLIEAAVEMGALLADLNPIQKAALLTFAKYYGLAFQIQDDILDVTSTAAVMGKAVHKDAIEQKNTFPGLLGLAGAQAELEQTCQQAQQALQSLIGLDQTLLNSFLSYFDEQENK